MSQELLNKTKNKKRRRIVIAVVIVLLAICGCAGMLMKGGGDSAGTVTISIDCSDLSGQMQRLERPELKDSIPADGQILPETTYEFAEGESVFDCLYNVCRDRDIQMESSEDAIYKARYVEGIGHLYELDAGKRSGWTYYVNGEMPDVGCSKCILEDGMKIEWVYVVDYTKNGTGNGK